MAHAVPEEYRIPPELLRSGPGADHVPRFENVAPLLGLATFNLSGGAVVDDFDGDEHLDLFSTTFDTRGEPRFFRNRGDGTFEDKSDAAGLSGLFGGLNLVHADYDNDGDLDVLVLRGAWLGPGGRHPNSLLRNDTQGGETRFVDVTFEAGLAEPFLPTQTAAWADYDNDGDVDLFVGNEHGDGSEAGPEVMAAAGFDAPSQLFQNQGDGTFVDVAAEVGIDLRAFVKGVVWGDIDNDRDPDLYVSILGDHNRLYRNDGGRFVDIASEAGTTEPKNSFPVWFWDYDNDGHLDLWAPSYRGSRDGVTLVAAAVFGMDVPWDKPVLYRGNGQGSFRNVTREVGLERLVLPMGSNFGDLDNDGWLDMYLGTGYPDYEALMPNVLYLNARGERFVDATWAAGFGHLQKGHAVSFADYDEDGDQDVFAQMGGAFPGDRFGDALFENPGFSSLGETANRYIRVRLVGETSNRAGIGARLRVDMRDASGRRSIHRRVNSGGSFGCNPLRQHVGLGQAQAIERLVVYWPTSDTTQEFVDLPLDVTLRIREGAEQPEVLSDN